MPAIDVIAISFFLDNPRLSSLCPHKGAEKGVVGKTATLPLVKDVFVSKIKLSLNFLAILISSLVISDAILILLFISEEISGLFCSIHGITCSLISPPCIILKLSAISYLQFLETSILSNLGKYFSKYL